MEKELSLMIFKEMTQNYLKHHYWNKGMTSSVKYNSFRCETYD